MKSQVAAQTQAATSQDRSTMSGTGFDDARVLQQLAQVPNNENVNGFQAPANHGFTIPEMEHLAYARVSFSNFNQMPRRTHMTSDATANTSNGEYGLLVPVVPMGNMASHMGQPAYFYPYGMGQIAPQPSVSSPQQPLQTSPGDSLLSGAQVNNAATQQNQQVQPMQHTGNPQGSSARAHHHQPYPPYGRRNARAQISSSGSVPGQNPAQPNTLNPRVMPQPRVSSSTRTRTTNEVQNQAMQASNQAARADAAARRAAQTMSLQQVMLRRQEALAQMYASYLPPAEPRKPQKSLDCKTDGRPEPKEAKDLTVNLECKICFSQLVDTVVIPCGHAVFCRWCADQEIPSTNQGDIMVPIDKRSKCPICRAVVKRKFRIYIS